MNEIKSKPKPVKTLRVRKVKKSSQRKLLINNLDKIVREIVLDRDVRCVVFPAPAKGHSDVRQAGHIISRTKWSVRWSLFNVHSQCSSCNMLHEHFSFRYINWFLGEFGVDKYRAMCQEAETVSKLQLYELQELLDQLKKIRQKQLVENLTGNTWKPYFSQADILSGAWNK